MEFENEKARILFLKYAIPCKEVLVKRGTMSKEYFDNLVSAVAKKEVPKGVEKDFKLAFSMCGKIAKNLGRKIDEEVIRKYFWIEHEKTIKKAYEGMMQDFTLEECTIYPGKVISSVINREALIKTPIKSFNYRTDFVPKLVKGDNVTVHYNFIAEIISEKDAKMLWGLRTK